MRAAQRVHRLGQKDNVAPAPAAVRVLRQRARKLEHVGTNAEAGKLVTDAFLAGLATSAGIELAPVSAILGGMVGSEVIKIISGKERPINNLFVFNGKTSDGVVQRLGPSFDCPWGLDKGDFKEVRANTGS